MSAVIPGILENEWDKIREKIELVLPFTDSLHIDLLDGKFAENTTWLDPEPFAQYTKDKIFELHLMVDNPLQYVEPFAQAGFTRFLGHVEKMPDQQAFVAKAEQYGEVGLVIDAHTSLDRVQISYEDLDCLLIMTVKAGFSGQAFVGESLKKVQTLSEKHPFLTIEVDGGITKETLQEAYHSGARRFVATSAIFGSDDPKKAYHSLSEIVAKEVEASVLPG